MKRNGLSGGFGAASRSAWSALARFESRRRASARRPAGLKDICKLRALRAWGSDPRRRGRLTSSAGRRALGEPVALARVPRQRRSALELDARFVQALCFRSSVPSRLRIATYLL